MLIDTRKEIQKVQEENNKLTTKVVRNRKIIALKESDLTLLKDIDSEESISDTSTQASFKIKQLPEGMDKVRNLYNTVCQCGAVPKFQGFCADCVRKMKETYEKVYQEFRPVSEAYERTLTANLNRTVEIMLIRQKNDKLVNRIQKGDLNEKEGNMKLLQDEIDLLSQKEQVALAEISLSQKEFNRFVAEKSTLQAELEVKIVKKEKKIKDLLNELKMMQDKNASREQKLLADQRELINQIQG